MTKQSTTPKSNGNGRERERAAIQALAQAVRLTVGVIRTMYPSSLVDELEIHVGRHLEAAERAVAWAPSPGE